MIKKALLVIFIIIIGGISGIISDRYLFPYLSTTDFFNKYKILKRGAQDITVINKTEQVYVKEDTTLTKLASQISSSIVNIISYSSVDAKTAKITGSNPTIIKNGTGVIATSDGLIMTYVSAINAENSKYKVMLADGNSYDAELQAVDSYSNLAFLKISASNLPVVSFGDSDNFKAGEKVIAIGNSLGNYQTMYNSGILNAYNPYYNISGKTVSSSEKLEGVFRTDLDNEDFYVGGPIVDYSGQVVGIIGAVDKDGKKDFFQIPSNKIKVVLDRAIAKNTDQNYLLGAYYVTITRTYALANNLNVSNGAMIYSPSGQQGLAIISGTPAAKAGLKINDIITQVANEKIDDGNSLPDLLYKHKKGESIELTILRDGQETKINVQL